MQTEFPEKYRILGLKIAYYRKKAGYTQEVFAEKINKSKIVIFGHTPVQFLGPDTPAKIYRRGSLIDIDCGCAFPGGRLGCLCLDTLEEIYI